MSRDRYATSYAQTSARPLLQRGITVMLIVTGVTLLILARAHHPMVRNVQARMQAAMVPVVEWVSQPVSGIRALVRDKNALLNAFDENRKMRAENDTLRHWQSVAQSLKAENDALRSLADYKPVENVSYITARVVGQSPNAYAATLLVNAGAEQGVRALQPVVDAHGLIGRITEVSDHTARVLLLSDSSSRVPVVTANGRQHAIAAGMGDGDALMRLTFLGGDPATVEIGEQVVTTEEGGLIPGGILVGTVLRRDATGVIVKPLRPLAQSEYVRVIEVK